MRLLRAIPDWQLLLLDPNLDTVLHKDGCSHALSVGINLKVISIKIILYFIQINKILNYKQLFWRQVREFTLKGYFQVRKLIKLF